MPDPHPPEETDAATREPIDPDVDLRQARRQGPSRRGRLDVTVLAAIAAGGAIGAAARYLIGQHWPTPAGAFPAGILAINLLGCALIGVLMVLITDVWSRQRLLRPFLGTALLYLTVTPVGALLAVWVTATGTRRLVNWRIK